MEIVLRSISFNCKALVFKFIVVAATRNTKAKEDLKQL